MVKFFKCILILILIRIATTINGYFIAFIVAPTVGENVATVLGVLLAIIIIYFITYLLLPWVGKAKAPFFISVGVSWFILTAIVSL